MPDQPLQGLGWSPRAAVQPKDAVRQGDPASPVEFSRAGGAETLVDLPEVVWSSNDCLDDAVEVARVAAYFLGDLFNQFGEGIPGFDRLEVSQRQKSYFP